MASLDVIALDPTVPQLRAPGVGDTYHFCRVVEFQDGTDAAPSITNVGDTNTGIYWPNADELAVSTGGVQRMSLGATTVFNETGADVDFRIEGDTDANLVFVDASTDRVGLGLNNPDRLLDVDGSSKFRGQILITSGEALGLGLQALQLPTGVESTIGAGLSTRTGVAGESIIQFGNNMNTYYTGSVNAAKAGAMIRIDTRGVEPTPGASAYSVFQIQTRAAGVADPNYTVPVQIGAAPQGTFCIQTNGLATFNYGFVVNEGGGDYDTRFEGDTDTHLFFADASTDRIGIGTNAPGYKLDVNGTANFANNVTFTGGTANGVLYLNGSKVATSGSALTFSSSTFTANNTISANNGTNILNIDSPNQQVASFVSGVGYGTLNLNASPLVFQIAGSEAMRLTSTGLGIGTSSPAYPLHVERSSYGVTGYFFTNDGTRNPRLVIYGSADGTTLQHTWSTNASNLIFASGGAIGSGTEIARFDSSGNLGIGTSSPANKLHVVSSGTTPAKFVGATACQLNLDDGTQNANWGLGVGGVGITGIASPSTYPLVFYTNGVERARIDSSGNLGLGVTPAAWVGFKSLDFSAVSYSDLGNIRNGFYNGSNYIYRSTAAASLYQLGSDGSFVWYNAPSGTAGNTISFTQAMTLDADGDLGVGTTSPTTVSNYRAITVNGTNGGILDLKYGDTLGGRVVGNSGGLALETGGATIISLQTNSTERARITSGGYFKASNAGTYQGSTGSYHELRSSTVDENVVYVSHTNATTPIGITVKYTAASPNGTGSAFLYCADSTALRAEIRSNGGLANYQSNNVDLSDARTKNSITPAASMWDKIGALEIVTYKYNDQTHDDVNVGVIAQQVESVEPVWVDNDGFGETPEGEEPLKTVYTKDITFAAIKALQEAMARIEKLEAEMAALKGV